jgi:guanylate kinase
MFVLSAPSGAGKTTLSKLLQQNDNHITISISFTTRPIRPQEENGRDYHFVDINTFKEMARNDLFIEYVEVFGHFYGTPKATVENLLAAGEDVLFDIDWQGHRRLTAIARDDVASVFILPPSKQELYRRLQNRHNCDIDLAKFRQERADDEIRHWNEYDYIIINKNIEESLDKLLSILRAERLKQNRRIGLPAFIGHLMQQEV